VFGEDLPGPFSATKAAVVVGLRTVWLTEEHKGNGSRRYIRALLPLLVVRSTVKRGPKQE
jgi:hypothetical protein